MRLKKYFSYFGCTCLILNFTLSFGNFALAAPAPVQSDQKETVNQVKQVPAVVQMSQTQLQLKQPIVTAQVAAANLPGSLIVAQSNSAIVRPTAVANIFSVTFNIAVNVKGLKPFVNDRTVTDFPYGRDGRIILRIRPPTGPTISFQMPLSATDPNHNHGWSAVLSGQTDFQNGRKVYRYQIEALNGRSTRLAITPWISITAQKK